MLKVAERWFELRRIDDDITLIFEPHVVPFLRCNIWHVRGRDRDLVIDTGMGVASLREFAKDILDKPVTAVATHVHIDHIGNHHDAVAAQWCIDRERVVFLGHSDGASASYGISLL